MIARRLRRGDDFVDLYYRSRSSSPVARNADVLVCRMHQARQRMDEADRTAIASFYDAHRDCGGLDLRQGTS